MSDSWSLERTADGSQTVYSTKFDAHYHSMHGALQESKHVFIQKGLVHWLEKTDRKEPAILEYGMGTGLNVVLTLLYAEKEKLKIDYHSIEGYPVPKEIYNRLDYFERAHLDTILSIHETNWNSPLTLSPYFNLYKEQITFEEFRPQRSFDIIYFDAFGPRSQPHLWTEEILAVAYEALRIDGILVTFCAQGAFKRALRAVGFDVERVPGPPGKREMTRATKSNVD